jgi:hypothetical protein
MSETKNAELRRNEAFQRDQFPFDVPMAEMLVLTSAWAESATITSYIRSQASDLVE